MSTYSGDSDEFISEREDEPSTTSVNSELLGRIEENGRRYQDGNYWLPNDDTEQQRQKLRHQLLSCAGTKYMPSLKHPQNVLDIGTGTGDWAVDFADLHESAVVKAIDLTPIQPIQVPPNVIFEIDDLWCLLNDPENENKFDVVRIGNLDGSIRAWDHFIDGVWKIVKPGGCVLWTEMDVGIYHGRRGMKHLQQWRESIEAASNRQGMSLNVGSKIEHLLQKAGFQNVEVQKQEYPLHPTISKRQLARAEKYQLTRITRSLKITKLNRRYAFSSFEPVALRPLTHANWQRGSITVLCAKARTEVQQHARFCYTRCFFGYAEKEPCLYTEKVYTINLNKTGWSL